MSIFLEEIEKQIRLLPLNERAALARKLIGELDPSVDQEVEQLWIDESERRYTAFLNGELEARPGDEVMTRARRRIR